MSVKQILDAKGRDVFTLRPEATLREATVELAERRIGAIVLVDDGGRIAGILSERDIVRLIGREGPGCLERAISEVMTRKVVTCHEATGIDELMETMTNGRFRHLPVEEGGRLVGLVSIGDAVKRRIEDVEREAEDMRSYISAAG